MPILSIAVITLFLVHELDAIKAGEYRMFPFIKRLPEEKAYLVFTALHIPLIFLILVLMVSPYALYLYLFWDIFAVIHIGLHLLLRNHPKNGFGSTFSQVLIYAAGVLGIVDLLVRGLSI